MAVFARPDETIRVPKFPSGPVRVLPRQFAPPQRNHWAWVAIGGLAVGVLIGLVIAFAGPNRASHGADRAKQASELLRLLRG